MARKVFVSYKYKDVKVAKLEDSYFEEVDGQEQWVTRLTRARDYVDRLQNEIGRDNMNLGERDGESLEDFSDQHIETLLKQRIRQCTITVVLLSKGMKTTEPEKDQWIPWEISYSLRVVPTGGNTKQRNAVLGVVLPDETGTYDWYYRRNPECNSIAHFTEKLFEILRSNMFNRKVKETRECKGSTIEEGEFSYIMTVEWGDFMASSQFYIEKAIEIRDQADDYNLKIQLD